MPPNTNASYNKYTSLLNYSNNPNVMYNPSKNDFIEFASLQIKKKYPELDFKPESSTTGLEKIISGLGNTMVSNFLTDSTTQKDYIILSIFEVDMKLARDFGIKEKNIKVLGVAGNFLPMPELK